MDKLTIEQKAKAYDEALERAKELLEVGLKDTRDKRVVLSFFPELAECKDERIRKYLITYFSDIDDSASSLKGKDVVAWLEKQGEQKPANKIQLGKKYRCIASPRYSTFVRGFIYKPEDKFLCSLMNFCCDCFEPIEDSEQKSNLYVEIPFGAKDSELQEASYYIPEGFHAEIDGNKVVIKRGEQKPTAWSEEDEKMFSQISDILWEGYKNSTGEKIPTWDNIREWCLSIKDRVQPQPRQEYDDMAYEMSRAVLYDKLKDSLSPQSQWRPSDAQMKQLGWIAEQNKDNMIGKELMTLYQDLKKLREE